MKTPTMVVKADAAGLRAAAAAIRGGGLVVYPTETSYGLAADATKPSAVEKVFGAKGRKREKAIPIIVADLRMAAKYCRLTPLARELAEEFMPGPLTLVVKKKGNLARNISRVGTVAFRIPGHSFAQKLARAARRPITATSANAAGEPPIHRGKEGRIAFAGKVDVIVDAGRLPKQPPSTIIDATGTNPVLLRGGRLAKNAMKKGEAYAKVFAEAMKTHDCGA